MVPGALLSPEGRQVLKMSCVLIKAVDNQVPLAPGAPISPEGRQVPMVPGILAGEASKICITFDEIKQVFLYLQSVFSP
jgi:hypothetical protein